MEVDFVTGRTCVTPGGLCFPVHLLSPIGKVRLRLSIAKALPEFGMVRSGRLGYYISPPRYAGDVALLLQTVRGKIELAA